MINKIKRSTLSNGVTADFIPTARFKTARLSVSFYLPIREDTASAYALLPFILTGCGKEYPTSRIISRELDNLYNASLSCECTKIADMQVLSVAITCMENKYALDGSDIVLKCVNMLSSLIFNPLCDQGGFDEQNFEKEKRLMIERIDSEINNKRSYALNRCVAEMCKGEPCSIARYGSREGQVNLTRKELYAAWETLLRTAYVRIGYLASEENEKVFDILGKAFNEIDRKVCEINEPIVNPAKESISEIFDRMPVKQGKLVMGFRTDIHGSDKDTYKVMVTTDLFGGGPYSRLFDNVREKMSLCYYCAARANRGKGYMTVDSGVEFDNMDKTLNEVLNQLGIVCSGEFDGEVLAASKRALCDTFHGVEDSQTLIDRWYADRVFTADAPSPDEVAELINSVTEDDVIETAKSFKLDTVYRLLGQEEK